MLTPVHLAVEGVTDEPVVRRLLAEVGLPVGQVYGRGGKPLIDARLAKWNRAALWSPWFVLRDLDQDAECAPELKRRILPQPSARMCLRIAVHSVEAWLPGDRERAARWLGVPSARIPRQPETVRSPKLVLIELARASRRPEIRKDIVPRESSTARVGPGYLGQIDEFMRDAWRPRTAAHHCPSLAGCLRALERLAQAT